MSRPTATGMLATLAERVGAARAPYYMRAGDVPPGLERSFPADGWYWVPPAHHVAVFLARNVFEARDVLVELLHRNGHDQEDDDDRATA